MIGFAKVGGPWNVGADADAIVADAPINPVIPMQATAPALAKRMTLFVFKALSLHSFITDPAAPPAAVCGDARLGKARPASNVGCEC